jgi:hypothetical protein
MPVRVVAVLAPGQSLTLSKNNKMRAELRRARSGDFAARNSMSGVPPHSTHWCRHGLAEPEPPIKGLAPRFAGRGIVCERFGTSPCNRPDLFVG